MSTKIVDQIEIKIPCKAEYVHTVRQALNDFAQMLALPKSSVEALEIAASEAITNVIKHAYADFDDSHPVKIRITKSLRGLTVEIVDKGHGFVVPDNCKIPQIDPDRDGGYGILLIKNMMDRVKYTSKPDIGTKIRMTKKAKIRH